jgi:hypothetical protein
LDYVFTSTAETNRFEQQVPVTYNTLVTLFASASFRRCLNFGSFFPINHRSRITVTTTNDLPGIPITKTTMNRCRQHHAECKRKAIDKIGDKMRRLKPKFVRYQNEQNAIERRLYMLPGLIHEIEAEIAQTEDLWYKETSKPI